MNAKRILSKYSSNKSTYFFLFDIEKPSSSFILKKAEKTIAKTEIDEGTLSYFFLIFVILKILNVGMN